MINGETRLAGVIGWPVSHSRSPLLHNYWCRTYQVNGAYVPLPVPPKQLKTAVHGLVAAGFCGANVTIPHKEAVFHVCDRLTTVARRAGAVNTLSFDQGEIVGDCTDGVGFCDNLAAHGVSVMGKVLILGAGGAARAVAASLLDHGCDVLITNRSPERARALVNALGAGEVIAWEEWPEQLAEASILVNATSLGMNGQLDFDWNAALADGHEGLRVADIVYTPRQTPLLKAAQKRGWQTVDGLGMLIYQARAGFERWFGVLPDVDKTVFDLLAHDLNLEIIE